MNVLLLLKNLSRFGGHPLYDSLHSSTKLLILIDLDYDVVTEPFIPERAVPTHSLPAAINSILSAF